MDHHGLPVSGYQPQSQSAVDLVNENKRLEEILLRRIEELLAIVDEHPAHPIDGRWAAIAKTHFEQGFMALNRAVFKPQRLTSI